MRLDSRWLLGAAASAWLLGMVHGCGGSETASVESPGQSTMAVSAHDGGADMSRCDFRGRVDREVTETAGPGAVTPNVRRVYAVVGEGDESRRVLICREVDTNLDGSKDVVRVYSDQGEALNEQADTNYDGRIDTWITFSAGRIGRLEIDTDHDGRPDETQYYSDGDLARVERDTNRDGRPDVWEIYDRGSLQRMGVDLDGDGHVDRWNRDEVAARAAEAKEREEEERLERQKQEAAVDGGVTDARVSARNR